MTSYSKSLPYLCEPYSQYWIQLNYGDIIFKVYSKRIWSIFITLSTVRIRWHQFQSLYSQTMWTCIILIICRLFSNCIPKLSEPYSWYWLHLEYNSIIPKVYFQILWTACSIEHTLNKMMSYAKSIHKFGNRIHSVECS